MKKATKVVIAVLVVALIVLAAVLAARSYISSEKLPKEKVINIGSIQPMTGASASYGQKATEGISLALEDINAAGGINGRKMNIIYEDSQSQSALAVGALQKLVNVDHVSAVLVSPSSPETLAEAPIAENNQTVILAAGSAATSIRYAGDYVFRLKVSVDNEVEELMRLVYDELEARSICIIYVQNDYGESVSQAADEIFQKMGGKVLRNDGFMLENTDFRVQLMKAKLANPDTIVLIGWPKNMGNLLKQAKELGVEKRFVCPGGAIDQKEIIDIAGNAADGLIYTMEYDLQSEEGDMKRFRDNFKKKYGKDPELFAAMGFDAVKIIAKTMEKCGENSTCIKDALYQVQDYQGACGTISFDEYGDVVKPMQYMTIKDGMFVRYEE